MQSSPPQRAAGRAASPAGSEYSIDLAAFGTETHSGASTPLPTQNVDRILTDDIDGPSDFTQNMEAYFRTGTLRKGGLQSVKERREDGGGLAPPIDKDAGALTAEDVDDKAASNHTPSASPPKESLMKRQLVNDDNNEDAISEWEPEDESPTPTLQHEGFHQARVEEHNSGFMPAHFVSTHAPTESNGRDIVQTQRASTKSERSASEDATSVPTASRQPSPNPQRQAVNIEENGLSEQLEQFRMRCERLESLNATLNTTINEERQARKQESTAHEAQIADLARRERDFTEMRDQSHQHKEDFRKEFADLKNRVAAYERQQEFHRSEVERLKREHASEIKNLQIDLGSKTREHSREMRSLEQDIELAHRSRDNAEETARINAEELDEQVAELNRLNMEIQQGEELREGIKEQLRNARMENERLEGWKKAAEESKKELDQLRQTTEKNVGEIKSEHRSAIQDLSTELETAKKQLQDQDEQNKAREIEAAETVQKKAEDDRVAHNYNYAIIERDELKDDLSAARKALAAERSARKADLKAKEVVNTALASRVSRGIRTREEYWRGRLKEMEDERRVMVKALLRAWGREELGDGLEDSEEDGKEMALSGWQMYKYLYALAEEKGKGGRKKVDFALS